jgi:hypothetical protein
MDEKKNFYPFLLKHALKCDGWMKKYIFFQSLPKEFEHIKSMTQGN